MKKNSFLFVLPLLSIFLFSSNSAGAAPGDAQWAKTATSGINNSFFQDVAADSSGNAYAVGYIDGTGQYDFGNGVTVDGANTGHNILVVKYNSNGIAQWARSLLSGGASRFYDVAIDHLGNIYAAGYIVGATQSNFDNGITVTGSGSAATAVVVKYDSNGLAQWARSTVTEPGYSYFEGVSVDSSGNVYAVGMAYGNGQYNFGNSVTLSGAGPYEDLVIVKYNSSGTAQWARSTVVAPDASGYNDVSTDSFGNAYAVGYINNTGQYNLGNSITVAGASNAIYGNIVIVKYNSGGTVQWARSVGVGSDSSFFKSVATDFEGNIYAVGEVWGTNQYDFGNSVTISDAGTYGNAVIAKYDSGGTTQWARSVSEATNSSSFDGVAADPLDNGVYAVGGIGIYGQYNFGNNISLYSTLGMGTAIVKYNSDGTARWAKTVASDYTNYSDLKGVSTDSDGNSFSVGHIIDNLYEYDFGNSVTVTGAFTDSNSVIIKYEGGDTTPPNHPTGLAVS